MSSWLGSRVGGLRPSLIREMNRRKGPRSVDLTLGQPSLPPEPRVVQAAFDRMASEGYGYTENAGRIELRALIAEHHRLQGRDRAENVVVTVGCEQAVYLSLTALVESGDQVLIPEPSFPAYRGVCRLLSAEAVPYPIDRSTDLIPRVEQLEARATSRTRALVLNDPSNPFGSVCEPARLAEVAAFAEAHDLVVVSDEIYRDLVYEGRSAASVAEHTDRAMLIGGLSKSCALTGFRLGYLVADAEFARAATLVNQLQVTCAPRPAQYAAIEVFQNPELLRAHLPFYEAARARLRAGAEALPEDAPLLLGEGAFYAVLDVSAHVPDGDPMPLALALLDAEDVVVVPGTAFGPSGGWFWRMSYAAGAEVAGEGLARIARFLRSRATPEP